MTRYPFVAISIACKALGASGACFILAACYSDRAPASAAAPTFAPQPQLTSAPQHVDSDPTAVLKDRSNPVGKRLEAVRQLAERQRGVVDSLTSALAADDDQEVTFQIAMALGDISDPRALPTLQHINQTLKNPSDDLAMAIDYAIEHCKVEDHTGGLRAVAILNHKLESAAPEAKPESTPDLKPPELKPEPNPSSTPASEANPDPKSSTAAAAAEIPAISASVEETLAPDTRGSSYTPHYTETSSGLFAATAVPGPSGLIVMLTALARKSRRRTT